MLNLFATWNLKKKSCSSRERHLGSASPDGTVMAILRGLGASVHASGFKKLALYNTHNGFTSLD